MITGFNTDIEHDGVVYHVQTEDKGLDSPLILSLVYSGGTILASKRSRYEDLIAAGFDEAVLSERLKRQHRLICAAITAGRINDLKRMSAKAGTKGKTKGKTKDTTEAVANVEEFELEGQFVTESETTSAATVQIDDTIEIIHSGHEMYTETFYSRDTAPLIMPEAVLQAEALANRDLLALEEGTQQYSPDDQVQTQSGLTLAILDDLEFHSGQTYSIHIMLEDTAGLKPKPVAGVEVSVKILGTAFRPQIYSINTERSGVAIVSATMPNFTTGRAAVLIRAVVKDETIELRRVIHPTDT